ncbi:hypothetical protein Vafri_9004 [Volvox africanus]|uniref:Uncharacterized protein n=1 Tax=Volvox africanus TaxID=51714 RepID=A0A8J4B488_9CHLO|nr:hypothetical protein Vafri_9004 [Volvox africanus]
MPRPRPTLLKDQEATDRASMPPQHADTTLHALLSELLRPELPQLQHSQHHRLEPAVGGMEGPAKSDSVASKEATTAADGATLLSVRSQGTLDLSWWWGDNDCDEEQKGDDDGVPATSLTPSPSWTSSLSIHQQDPRPPLSLGPCGLTHPGYEPYGFLRRPYALQLAWAAAVWRVTDCFPYPVIRQQRPPLLRESDMYNATMEEVEALVPLLLPEVATDSSFATATATPATAAETPLAALKGSGPFPVGNDVCNEIDGDEIAGDNAICGTAVVPPVTMAAPAAQQGTREADMDSGPITNLAAVTTDSASASAAAALRRLLLNVPAVYLLLGFRLTAGSASRMVSVPSVWECFEAFERKHSPLENASVLTVGARALSKHTHRDVQGEWWPRMKGSEPRKNQLARGSLQRLLAGALWLNVHQLPPFDAPKHVLEIRNLQPPPQSTSQGSKSFPASGERRDLMTADVLSEAKEGLGPCGQATGSSPGMVLAQQTGTSGSHQVQSPGTIGNAHSTAPFAKPPATLAARIPSQEAMPQIPNRGIGTGAVEVAFRRPAVQFRGFLEPQMEGGHEAGWRH